MPLFKTITVNKTTKVYIWKIDESFEELSKNIELTQKCRERVNKMKSDLHRRGFISVRHLLAEAGYTDFDLYYSNSGKPHLKDGKHISITHSFTFSGIIVSDDIPVGIDIEKQRDKIVKIAHKFTPIEEYKTIANHEALVQKLTIVWGAKESLYKIYNKEGLSFLNSIVVDDFSFDATKITASIHYKNDTSHYKLSFTEFEGFTCVYALNSQ